MILFHQETRFINRVLYRTFVPILYFIAAFVFFCYLFYSISILLCALLIAVVALVATWEIARGYKGALYWLEYLEVKVEKSSTLIRLLKKDMLVLDKEVPLADLHFVMVPIPGNPTTTYKTEIYIKSILVGTIYQLYKMDKYKMKEIVLFFNTGDKIANRKRL